MDRNGLRIGLIATTLRLVTRIPLALNATCVRFSRRAFRLAKIMTVGSLDCVTERARSCGLAQETRQIQSLIRSKVPCGQFRWRANDIGGAIAAAGCA